MKVRFLLFFFFVFYTYTLHAQQFKGFVQVGINASQIDGDRLVGFL